MLERQPWHHLATAPLQADLYSVEGIDDGAILTVFLHVVLVAESRLQLNPVGAWHQREKGVAHVEVEQVAATGVCHQQQAAFVQPPEFLHGPTWGAFVLRQNPQLPARGGLNVVESLFQTGALGIGEGLGEIDHRRRVVRQQLGIVVGVNR